MSKRFVVNVTRMYAAVIVVEAEDEEQAENLARRKLAFEDTSTIEWEPIRKSEVIEEVYET